ncbi:antibiotic biosynthesis monooxygenase [Nonomuraea zeae]|uniref:ABM domain-containing protein n=1 Tax=Nonomuraea zeae TaxID=1642303 RepID=A0A5S4H1F6_9ACTN|nr:antibiotic biosynthesis monooxygenase [Nonomuraea zeae]TMR38889.1 hypothetical protein ETD85_03510 [Nonomuraea zeae]
MIARIWHATATAEGAAAYERHFAESVLPALRSVEGHRGAYLLRRDGDGQVELQVMTMWDSWETIQGFAGAEVSRAVVEPAAEAALTGFDTTVSHHTVVASG